MRKLGLVLLLLPGSLTAQSIITVAPSQCVWQTGDDAAWAAPAFDDSKWVHSNTPLTGAAHLWMRCRVRFGGLRGLDDPAIQVKAYAAYELFVDGVRVGAAGSLATGEFSEDVTRSFSLPTKFIRDSPSVVAGRVTVRGDEANLLKLRSFSVRAGDPSLLAYLRDHEVLAGVTPILPYVVMASILGIIGLMQMGFFYFDRSRRDLLWVSIYCVTIALLRLNALLVTVQPELPRTFYESGFILGNFSFVFELLAFFALVRRRVPWYLWVLFAVSQIQQFLLAMQMLLSPERSMQMSGFTHTISTISLSAWSLLCTAPFIAFWPWNRIAPRLRPLAACCFLWGLADFVNFAAQASNFNFVLQNIPTLVEVRTIISGAAIFILLILLFRDQRKLIEERALLAGEMQSARTIQRMLSPEHIPAAPGIAINVDFRPMREVGGDFYLSRVLHDGRQRLIVGDVSGKGTAAAMTAALLIGAAEDHDALSPGELLAHLDRVLRATRVGGFATCLCADLAPGGHATVANAGHLPPYCRGLELPLPPGLPLGVADDLTYPETTLVVAPGETLTFVSDGVVEARNAVGQLLGFDRTAELSTRPAGEIAATAQSFGQEDDITVITLTFAAAGLT